MRDPRSGVMSSFAAAPDEVLECEPSCWTLQPHDVLYGFGDLDAGYCMLDPVKVTLTTPGIDAAGRTASDGIPAPVVAAYLDGLRIEVEKTGDYTLLVLFSIGTTTGKWGSLLVPYPPGIPVLMPGERAGDGDGLVLQYLLALQALDRRFPGFPHDIHGVERDEHGTSPSRACTRTPARRR